MTDFLHLIDLWLSAHGRQPAQTDARGPICCHLPSGFAFGTELLADGRFDLFASPGYVSGEQALAAVEGGALRETGTERDRLLQVETWTEGASRWRIAYRARDGLVVVTRNASAPQNLEQWDAAVRQLEALCVEKALSLSPDQIAFDVFMSPARDAREHFTPGLLPV